MRNFHVKEAAKSAVSRSLRRFLPGRVRHWIRNALADVPTSPQVYQQPSLSDLLEYLKGNKIVPDWILDLGAAPETPEFAERLPDQEPTTVLAWDSDPAMMQALGVLQGSDSATTGLIKIHADRFAPGDVLAALKVGSLKRVIALLIEAKLADYWSGKVSFASLTIQLSNIGFSLLDLLESPALKLDMHRARLCVIYLHRHVYRRLPYPWPFENTRPSRLEHAWAFLTPVLLQKSDATVLAARDHEFLGGIFNPGVVSQNDQVLMLARGERYRISEVRASLRLLLKSCLPVLLRFTPALTLAERRIVNFEGSPATEGAAVEDFRLFLHGDRIFSNHTVVRSTVDLSQGDIPYAPSRVKVSIGLSQLEPASARLRFLGEPAVDFPVSEQEKNWAFFSFEGTLYLLYSLFPFRLLKLSDWDSLRFETVAEKRLDHPIVPLAGRFSNSTNPIDYDPDHYLTLVHKRYPNFEYVFWAVLIGKRDLMPSKITACPLVRGDAVSDIRLKEGLVYVSSVLCTPESIHLFFGLNDAFTGHAAVARADLEQAWVSL
jgi:hypothetical protein